MEFRHFLENEELTALARKAGVNISRFDPKEIRMGLDVEKEHSGGMGKDVAVVSKKADILKIAIAHLREDPRYYSKLKKYVED